MKDWSKSMSTVTRVNCIPNRQVLCNGQCYMEVKDSN